MAEAMRDHMGPGGDIVTEDPETDVILVALGGSLDLIAQAMQMVDQRGTVSSGIAPVLAGLGDPVLKSGASPSSIQQLIQQAGQKFERVDENIRESLSQLFQFIPELLAQYAPAELFFPFKEVKLEGNKGTRSGKRPRENDLPVRWLSCLHCALVLSEYLAGKLRQSWDQKARQYSLPHDASSHSILLQALTLNDASSCSSRL